MKDKRDKTIYQAAKQRFQSNACSNNQNIKLYNNGKIRNVINHTFQKSLARGNVLCEDCNNKGLLCGDVAEPNLAKNTMGNNNISEFWGGSFMRFEADGSKGVQAKGFVVFSADVSGTWGPVYDDDGNLVNGSLMSYLVPSAAEVPSYELDNVVAPSPTNPLGVKGVGETGAIASTPAVVNAVLDALSHLGVTDIDMPTTPERVWRAIEEATG